MMKRSAIAALSVWLVACSTSNSGSPNVPTDSGVVADSTTTEAGADSGSDGGVDSSLAPTDAGADAPMEDAVADASGPPLEASIEAESDALADATENDVSDASLAPSPAGVWVGTYTCAQGVTGLTLTVADDPDGGFSAVFSFYPVSSNPNVPQGSFNMTGTYYEEVAHLVLTATNADWIQRPAGYNVVDLDGSISPDGTTYSGSVSTCTAFTLTLQVGSLDASDN